MGEQADNAVRLAYQMDVYFAEFPRIDAGLLEKFVNECDPEEQDRCTVSKVAKKDQEEAQLASFAVTMGDFSLAILIHGVPSPAGWVIEESRLPQEAKERLAGHKAFALLTNFGGGEYAPYESLIFLYKIAMGLCRQGALGVGCPHNGLCLPAPLLLGLLEAGEESVLEENEEDEPEEGEAHSLWKSIREDGEPRQLFAEFGAVNTEGAQWVATRGFAHCGFPDFIYRLEPDEDPAEIVNFYENAFSYLMTNGPVIEAGHTMGYDEEAAYRFSEPPADLKLPFETYGLLLVTKEAKKKRKKLFGLL